MRYWVVPHTHWDREWYLRFEQFRFQLARTIDEVLDVLEAEPSFRCFTLDGQAVVLEDYLEVRPRNEERLRRLVDDGRIAIGPWYTLPDEYLVGAESLVRNLLVGRQACERTGHPMAVGYLPDTFGHVAQLPQLLRGFGLDTFVFWRGLGDEAVEVGAAFRWRGPDGSDVLAIRELGGYGNADQLVPEKVEQLTERFAGRYAQAGLDDLLLSNGTDHRPIQRDLPAVLADCSERIAGSSFRIATIEEYVDHVRSEARGLPTVEGELCGGGDIAVLRGVNSTRMWIKQANEAAERELFAAEALASLASLRGTPYPAGELAVAWKELLRNHAHDSICGCSVDEVHRDMAQRFETARSIAAVVRRASLAALAGQGPPWTHRPLPAETRAIVNVLPFLRHRLVELELPAPLARARSVSGEIDGEPIPVQVERGRVLLAVGVPGLGARRVTLRRAPHVVGLPGSDPGTRPTGTARAISETVIENDHLRVEVAANGTLSVTAVATGETAVGLHLFEDVADRGDEYNFCELEGEEPWTSRDLRARVRTVREGPVVAELEIALRPRLPSRLARDRRRRMRETVSCPVTTRVRLTAGVKRVELRTTVENRARDHRLRALFPVPGVGPHVRVEGHFAVLRRTAQPVWNGRWSEPPQTTHHTLGAVAAGQLCLLSRGLPEYEAVPRERGLDLALTLLRCVGWLSRNDLSNRFHHAGPPLETPEAQCLGRHAFEYALALDGRLEDAALARAAQDYRVDFEIGPDGISLGALELDGDAILSCLKQAEDGDGLILRAFNPGARPSGLVVRGSWGRLERCRLDETPLEQVGAEVSLRSYEVITLRLR